MKKVSLLALGLIIVGAVVGITVVWATADSGEAIQASLNSTFDITLDSNPSTGYSWQAEYDETYLELVDQTFQVSSEALGAPGKEVFTFRALNGGETRVTMEYKRPWEATALKSEVFKVKVNPSTGGTFNEVSKEESLRIARQFLLSSSTFEFDGIEDSVKLMAINTLRCPYCWEFIFEFQTRHAGHGDRTGQVLAQVITTHTARIVVIEGNVATAICCGNWDMISQSYMGEDNNL